MNPARLFEHARRCECELRNQGVPGTEISAILGAAFIGSLDNLPPPARRLVIAAYIATVRQLLLEVMAQPGAAPDGPLPGL